MLVLLFVALCFILRGDLFQVLSCVILFLCFSVLSALQLPHLGKRERERERQRERDRERANFSVFRTFVRFALVSFLSVSSSS